MLKNILKMEQRTSLASAYEFSVGSANWNNWSVDKAVKHGFTASGWVYAAVSKIAKTASSVPWVVYNKDGEAQWEHPLSKLFAIPNPVFSGQDNMELIISWLELTGRAYLHRVRVGSQTRELWPVSPDRLEPVAGTGTTDLISSYKLDKKTAGAPKVEDVVYFRFFDPSNPIGGIGPLQAAAKAVDIDVEQQEWNKAAMENRGVLDGVFTIKQPLDPKQADTLWERIKERYTGKRNSRVPALFNGDVGYTRTAMTPVEADFQESRRWNRDEILAILGVPAILVGAMEQTTYNNYESSLKILWKNTNIPLLDDVKDTFNHAFRDELKEGEWIGYDLSGVSALRDDEDAKARTALSFWRMGVPVSELNEKYDLGLTAYPKWDQPWGGRTVGVGNAQDAQAAQDPLTNSAPRPRLREFRNIDAELAKRDAVSDGEMKSAFAAILDSEQKKLFAHLDAHGSVDASLKDGIKPLIEAGASEWTDAIDKFARKNVAEFAGQIVEGRDAKTQTLSDYIAAAIKQYIDDEKFVLLEVTGILETTIDAILLHVESGVSNGSSMATVQQAIIDSGIFDEARALRIARTEAGSAQSIGQLAAGTAAGATKKTWTTAGFGVRDLHQARAGVAVPIDGTWDNGIRFPLDPMAPAADRINCRCSMTFSL